MKLFVHVLYYFSFFTVFNATISGAALRCAAARCVVRARAIALPVVTPKVALAQSVVERHTMNTVPLPARKFFSGSDREKKCCIGCNVAVAVGTWSLLLYSLTESSTNNS